VSLPPERPAAHRRGVASYVLVVLVAMAAAGIGGFSLTHHLRDDDPAAASRTSSTPSTDAAALAALQRQAGHDRDAVGALGGAWTVQLSSKTDGTVDGNGRTWHWLDIWRLHEQLADRYPGALLVDTTRWRSYQLPDYFATVTGTTYADKAAALAWCREQGLTRDACSAKRIRADGDPAADSALQPR